MLAPCGLATSSGVAGTSHSRQWERRCKPLVASREVHHVKEGEGNEGDAGGPGSEGPWTQSSATGRTFSKKAAWNSCQVSAAVVGTPPGAADFPEFSRTPWTDLRTA